MDINGGFQANVVALAVDLSRRFRRKAARRNSYNNLCLAGGLEARPLALAFRRELQPMRRPDQADDVTDDIHWPNQSSSFVDGVHVTIDPGAYETYVYDVARNIIYGDMVFASRQSLLNFSTDLQPASTPYAYEGLVGHPWGVDAESSEESMSHSGDSLEFYLGRRWVGVTGTPTPIGILSEPNGHHFLPTITSWANLEEAEHGFESRAPSLFVSGWEAESDSGDSDLEEVYGLFKDRLGMSSTMVAQCEAPDTSARWQSTEVLDPERADGHHILEAMLEDMLQENINSIPLSAFPLQALESDSGYAASIDPPQIRPLTSRRPIRENPEVADHGSTNAVAIRKYRLLPLAPVETHRQPKYRSLLPVLDLDRASSPEGSFAQSPCDAPPPFPQEVTEIVDLIRMAAILLHRETRAALMKGCQDAILFPNSHILQHLGNLERLVKSWPDENLSAPAGIAVFKDALKDGTVLCGSIGYFDKTTASSKALPNQAVADNFRPFIDKYHSLDLPGTDSLDHISLADSSLEELAIYARAIIQVHGQLELTQPDDVVQVDFESIIGNAHIRWGGAEGLEQRSDCSSTQGDSVPSDASPTAQDATSSLLPEKEMRLYTEIASIVQDEQKWRRLILRDNEEAQGMIDIIHHLLTFPQLNASARSELLTILIRLSLATGLYPRALRLSDDLTPQIDKDLITCGAFGEIMCGHVKQQAVCIKVARLYREGSKSWAYLKSFLREIVVWGQLQHPNILPFYGVYHLGHLGNRICLVSPWMNNGNVNAYLRLYPSANKLLLVRDVASALEHLHNRNIVHGDLKGANILVSPSGRACLADFGLASVNDGVVRPTLFESTGHQGATPRYEAPELLSDAEIKVHRTTATDMYAFGCVTYEIITGELPFHELGSYYHIIVKTRQGEIPTRPRTPAYPGSYITDDVWFLMTRFWSKLPQDRPTAAEVMSTSLLTDQLDFRPEDEEVWSLERYRLNSTQQSPIDEISIMAQKGSEPEQFTNLIPHQLNRGIRIR